MSTKGVLTPFIKSLLLSPPNLTPEELSVCLRLIIGGQASPVQAGAFLTALRMRELDHKPEFIAAAANTVLEFSTVVDPAKVSSEGYVDIVGTGGDGQNTFNVSSSASIVAAGIGLPVAKHGGKASSSTSGAGDLLASLGADVMAVNAETAPDILANSPFCFLFAPAFHRGMKNVAALRADLGVPTIFNILGPLISPVPLKGRIIGVYSEALGQVFAEAVLRMNPNRRCSVMIVWGEEGLDEISPAGYTKVWRVAPGSDSIEVSRLHPSMFGLPVHPLSEVGSGTADENAAVLRKLLDNQLPEHHPILDYILLNAGALAVVEGAARDWKHGVELAEESVRSGSAKRALEAFLQATQKVKSN